jgi:amino-acid N-acetyltransferase
MRTEAALAVRSGARVSRAEPADEPAIEALLVSAGLPVDGAAAAFEHGVVVRDGEAIVGAAAVELFGDAGLLRSVAVEANRRGDGLGRELVVGAEGLAREAGVRDLYLLTDSAGAWFPRLGYEPVDREVARAVVGASIEFTLSCAETGVALRRQLG